MRAFTVHLPPEGSAKAPALLPERFAWGAFLFGPLWLLAHRLWLATLVVVALAFGLAALPAGIGLPGFLALALLLGLHGHDLRRWMLARRGWRLAHVVVERDTELAVARLVHERPDTLPLFAERTG